MDDETLRTPEVSTQPPGPLLSAGVLSSAPGSSGEGASSDTWSQRVAVKVKERLFRRAPNPPQIGRFTILERIGDGGMGTVYAAYDDLLDRKVAVKVLHSHELPTDKERQRFQREAQALARLSHPNVVVIHEVGDFDGESFLAMEYVRGQTLAQWLRDDPPWSEVLEAFVQAGRGLAAAHQADLVHRDLKPQNLMRSDDGAVKVLDFGVARIGYADADAEVLDGPDLDETNSMPQSSTLTLPGMVVGTPAYMSPEQHRGDPVDARSDQYSFCVTLWEALARAHPFGGSSLSELLELKLAGPPPWPDSTPAVPRRTVEALRRGLQPEPSDRWPSMAPLLDALSPAPRRRASRWRLGLAGAGMLGLGALWARTSAEPAASPCHGAEQALAGIWSEARSAEVEAAILGLNLAYSDVVWRRTQRELSGYADRWIAMHTEACEATAVRGEQSPQLLDLRMACLERSSQGLRAAVSTLADADAETVQRAHELVAGLRPLSRCADAEALVADVEPPLPADAQRVDAARMHLARADSLERAGRYEQTSRAITSAQEALEGVDYEPVRTELALARGSLLRSQGKYEESETMLTEALGLATRWRQHDAMARAAEMLMDVVGHWLKRTDAGLQYRAVAGGLSQDRPEQESAFRNTLANVLSEAGRHDEAEAEHRAALALLEQLPDPDTLDVARIRNDLANVLHSQGKYEEAEREYRASLALRREALGADHPAVIVSRANLAVALIVRGDFEAAEAESRAVIALRQRILGPDHPEIAVCQVNLSVALRKQGKYEEAEEQVRAALSLWERTLGPDHGNIAQGRTTLAIVLQERKKYDEAEAEFRAALALQQQLHGPDHLDVARAHTNLGAVLDLRGQPAAAETHLRQALEIQRAALGAEHPHLATTRNNLANALQALGRLEEAEQLLRAALKSMAQTLGDDHPSVTQVRHNLAAILLDLERPGDAVPLAEQAWSRRQRDGVPAEVAAQTSFLLARALWGAAPPARDRARALSIAQQARRSYLSTEIHQEEARRVQRWLEGHPRR